MHNPYKLAAAVQRKRRRLVPSIVCKRPVSLSGKKLFHAGQENSVNWAKETMQEKLKVGFCKALLIF